MKTLFNLLLVLALLPLAACESISVNADWDSQASFSELSNWKWLPRPPTGSGSPKVPSDILDRRVRSAVEQEFAAKGHAFEPEAETSFLVTYHVAIQQKLDVTTMNHGYYNRGGWGGSRTYVTQWDEGTLAIDVVNAESQELMWRGVATAVVGESKSPEAREARIREAVQKVLAQFPPGAAK